MDYLSMNTLLMNCYHFVKGDFLRASVLKTGILILEGVKEKGEALKFFRELTPSS